MVLHWCLLLVLTISKLMKFSGLFEYIIGKIVFTIKWLVFNPTLAAVVMQGDLYSCEEERLCVCVCVCESIYSHYCAHPMIAQILFSSDAVKSSTTLKKRYVGFT